MRAITITLPDEVIHRLEVISAKDGDRLAAGIEKLLTYLVGQFERTRENHGKR